jgi:sugar transferase EpsL
MRETLAREFAEKLKAVTESALALVFLLCLAPVLLTIGFAIWITSGKPVLFRQLRPGKNGRPFTLLKFRTMNTSRGPRGELLADEDRLTDVGIWLRRTSLDELPQLWNVLVGDMSFVGPRPLLVQYLDRYTRRQARRHEVRPGITGWAQINGRNALSWEEKFEMDVWYVDHWSLGLDLRILCATVERVLGRYGVSQPGRATAEEFLGSSSIVDLKERPQ